MAIEATKHERFNCHMATVFIGQQRATAENVYGRDFVFLLLNRSDVLVACARNSRTDICMPSHAR